MAFDENGQAASYEEKIRICERAYRILVDEVGFPPETSSLTRTSSPWPRAWRSTTTTRSTSSTHALDQGEPARRESERRREQHQLQLPRQQQGARSHAQRVLFHAIKAGMDMGIVNAGMLEVYEDIPQEMLVKVEDVLLNRRPDATEILVDYAEQFKGAAGGAKKQEVDLSWREQPVAKRLEHALLPRHHGLHR